MILRSTSSLEMATSELRSAYEAGQTSPDLARHVQMYGVRAGDALCDLVEVDVQLRAQRGLPVMLSRYLGNALGVAESDEFIDTVIDLAIQSRISAGIPAEQAADDVLRQRPDLASHVDDARALSDALAMSALVASRRSRLPDAPVRPPEDLGSPLSDGRPRYHIVGALGRGAFGQVYRAVDRALSDQGDRSEIAVKILNLIDNASLVEASRARRVRHPSVVRVYDHGALSDGRPFIVYELVEGRTLRERVEHSGHLPVREAVALMALVAEGVHAAHGVQVLHRDLNPGNILIDGSGAPRITDFGAAVGMDAASDEPIKSRPLGAPGFIAPEQWRGEGAESVQTDVFGLGALLFYALTGRCPNGATLEEARAFLEHSADRVRLEQLAAALPRDLRLIVLRALSADPAARYPSAAQFADDLRSWLGRLPIAWTRPGLFRRTGLLLRRKPLASAVAALAALVVVASVAFGAHWLGRIVQQRRDGHAWQASMLEAVGKVRREEQLAGIAAVTIVMETLAPESVMRVLFDPGGDTAIRISALSRLSELSNSQLGPQDPRTRTWRAAAALARLTEQNQREDTLAFVESVRDEWKSILPPDSIWMREMEVWVDCARVKQIFHKCYRISRPTPSDARTLREIAPRLEEALPLFSGWLESSPTRKLVLRTLGHVYGSHLLHQPEDLARITALRETVVPSPPRQAGLSILE